MARPFELSFSDDDEAPACCRAAALLSPNGTLQIALLELPQNHGRSVTNSGPGLAKRVLAAAFPTVNLADDEWFEVYPDRFEGPENDRRAGGRQGRSFVLNESLKIGLEMAGANSWSSCQNQPCVNNNPLKARQILCASFRWYLRKVDEPRFFAISHGCPPDFEKSKGFNAHEELVLRITNSFESLKNFKKPLIENPMFFWRHFAPSDRSKEDANDHQSEDRS